MARITGKDCSLYFYTGAAWVRAADLYEWELNYEDVLLDVSIKGDLVERMMPSHFRGRLSAKRWTEDVSGSLVFTLLAATNGRVEFAVLGIDTLADTDASSFSTSPVRVQATGYVTRGQAMVPREGVQDNLEIVLDTYPAVLA